MSDDKKDTTPAVEGEEKNELMPTEELNAADGTGSKLAVVETKTGEEDEEIMWKTRAKAYRFDEGEDEWKERGVGEIKFLKAKTGATRILMRRDHILKVCLAMNMSDVGALKDHQNSEKAWVFSGFDYSEDEEASRETMCLKFTSEENAKIFQKHFNECREKKA